MTRARRDEPRREEVRSVFELLEELLSSAGRVEDESKHPAGRLDRSRCSVDAAAERLKEDVPFEVGLGPCRVDDEVASPAVDRIEVRTRAVARVAVVHDDLVLPHRLLEARPRLGAPD